MFLHRQFRRVAIVRRYRVVDPLVKAKGLGLGPAGLQRDIALLG